MLTPSSSNHGTHVVVVVVVLWVLVDGEDRDHVTLLQIFYSANQSSEPRKKILLFLLLLHCVLLHCVLKF